MEPHRGRHRSDHLKHLPVARRIRGTAPRRPRRPGQHPLLRLLLRHTSTLTVVDSSSARCCLNRHRIRRRRSPRRTDVRFRRIGLKQALKAASGSSKLSGYRLGWLLGTVCMQETVRGDSVRDVGRARPPRGERFQACKRPRVAPSSGCPSPRTEVTFGKPHRSWSERLYHPRRAAPQTTPAVDPGLLCRPLPCQPPLRDASGTSLAPAGGEPESYRGADQRHPSAGGGR